MATREVRICHLTMAEPFVKLCDAGGVKPREALQRLLDHLNIYAHLAPKGDDESSAAMVLFQQYLQWRVLPQEPHDYLAEHYVRQLLQLVQSDRSPAQRRQEQQRIVEKWYAAWWPQPPVAVKLNFHRDALILERLFHISITGFLQFYINQLSLDGLTRDVSNNNERLAMFFFTGREEW